MWDLSLPLDLFTALLSVSSPLLPSLFLSFPSFPPSLLPSLPFPSHFFSNFPIPILFFFVSFFPPFSPSPPSPSPYSPLLFPSFPLTLSASEDLFLQSWSWPPHRITGQRQS